MQVFVVQVVRFSHVCSSLTWHAQTKTMFGLVLVGCPGLMPLSGTRSRMMSFAGESSSEIILDSGADTSALPLSFAHVGESCSHDVGMQDNIDAQGGKLAIKDSKVNFDLE